MDPPHNIKTIAIIGAGPSGLAAAKHLLAEEAFSKISIFEQKSEVGGLWNYTPSTSNNFTVPQTSPDVPLEKPIYPNDGGRPIFSTPMYEHLISNIPKNLMCFPDLEFPEESLLFPTREDVQHYLIRYSQDVRHLISFSTQVQEVRLLQDPNDGRDEWDLTTTSLLTTQTTTTRYDAVIIATGHYTTPFIPSTPGISAFHQTHPSIISHSSTYLSPQPFKSKKTLVIGSSASALDIGTQISAVCAKPLLQSIRSPSKLQFEASKKEEVPVIAEYIPVERAVRFANGRVEKDIDAIVYCTGYLFSFPFLQLPPEEEEITDGQRVKGVYKQMFCIRHPTLAFSVLPYRIIAFPIAYAQASAIARVFSGRLSLPTREEMQGSESKEVEEKGEGRKFHVMGFQSEAEYVNGLGEWVETAGKGRGKRALHWDEEMKWLRRNYVQCRVRFLEGGGRARSMKELGWGYAERGVEGI